jgi:hypothetical protein
VRAAVLLLGAVSALAAARIPLGQAVAVTLTMGPGHTCRLSAKQNEPKLTAVCTKQTQTLPIPILEGEPPHEYPGQILAADFDFDGYLDLMIPTATGYGGVNWFYDFYHYNPATRAFEPNDDTEGDFCNPEPVPAEKLLKVPCKDGPAWYDNAYKFANGKPYLYRSTELVHLNGFDGDDALVYRITMQDAARKPVKSAVAEVVSESKTVRRKLPFEKAFLHRAPSTIARTESYLVKGDLVELLEVKLDEEQQWLRILYRGAKGVPLDRWIALPPE